MKFHIKGVLDDRAVPGWAKKRSAWTAWLNIFCGAGMLSDKNRQTGNEEDSYGMGYR